MELELQAPPRVGVLAFVIAGLLIMAAAVLCGGAFGQLAHFLYSRDFNPGLRPLTRDWGSWVGSASGALVGLLWAWAMAKRARAQLLEGGLRPWRLTLRGVLLGVLAGFVSAACVHTVLQIVTARLRLENAVIGLVFGIVSGAIVGLIGALVFLLASRFARSDR